MTGLSHRPAAIVDAALSVGRFYLTMASHQNVWLKTEDVYDPIPLGPVLIHQKKLPQSYFELPE